MSMIKGCSGSAVCRLLLLLLLLLPVSPSHQQTVILRFHASVVSVRSQVLTGDWSVNVPFSGVGASWWRLWRPGGSGPVRSGPVRSGPVWGRSTQHWRFKLWGSYFDVSVPVRPVNLPTLNLFCPLFVFISLFSVYFFTFLFLYLNPSSL